MQADSLPAEPQGSPRRRKGGVKRGGSNLASNLIPKYSPQPGTPEEISQLHNEEKREEGNRGDLEEKRESQKGREQSSR